MKIRVISFVFEFVRYANLHTLLYTLIILSFGLCEIKPLAFGQERSKAYSEFLIAIDSVSTPGKRIDLCDSTLASGLLNRADIGMVHGFIGANLFEIAIKEMQGIEPGYEKSDPQVIRTFLARSTQHYSTAIAINPTLFVNFWNRGASYEIMGKHGKALDDYTRVIQIKQDFVNGYLYRARVLVARGEKELALADLEEAIRLEPRNPEVIAALKRLGN